jgi:hypothetical protein
MKLEDLREIYFARSAKASDLARQLALAGLAVIWIFKTDTAGAFAVPHELSLPAFLMMLTLGADLMQFACAALLWGGFNRYKERELAATLKRLRAAGKTADEAGVALNEKWGPAQEFTAPPAMNYPAIFFFWGKLVVVGIGYANLIQFLAARIGH